MDLSILREKHLYLVQKWNVRRGNNGKVEKTT